MKVSILGSGNGGMAVAFEWAKAGHDVFMFDFEEYGKNICDINKHGGIHSEGELDGFQRISYAGHDIEYVIKGAELVFIVGPAYSTESFGKACRNHVEKGQIFVVCPSSCMGALVFKNAIGYDIKDESVVIADTSTLPYAVRVVGEAKIAVYNRLKGDYFISALPSTLNDKVYETVGKVYKEMIIAKNILKTALQNANPVIHPSITLLNAGIIERKVPFLLYEEGVTEAVGRTMKALDLERIEIGKTLGVQIIPDPELGVGQGYMLEANYTTGYSNAPGFKGIAGPDTTDYRYINEDAGYGLVFFMDLAKHIGVKTPTMEAVVQMASVIRGVDFVGEGLRTMESLGISEYSIDELKSLL